VRNATPEEGIPGDRGVASADPAHSIQSRLTHLLAIGLISLIGVGLLMGYYRHAFTRQAQIKASTQAETKNRAQGEMALPSLGPIQPPVLIGPPPPPLPALPQEPEPTVTVQASPTLQATPVNPAPAPKTRAELALDRELSGPAFAGNDPGSQASEPPRATAASTPSDPLEGLLRPTTTSPARAERLPTQHLLLPKGAVVDCTLLTAIDSTLPGMTTCITATDTFSADGTVVLLERGTKLVGETRGEVQQGASRVFVLWTEARTPTGIVVPLASPGTDELGRSGLAGEVNRHFWQRFGAAMLVSLIEGGVQAAVTSSSNGGAVIVNPTTATEVSTEVLKSTMAIPPTLRKDNGDRIQVLVARDLDFRGVYELRAVGR